MSYRLSMQRAMARLLSFIRRPRAWLLVFALFALLPDAARAACGPFNVPDVHTTPSTSPMASNGSITVDVSGCDSSGFGLGDQSSATPPQHGSSNIDVLNDKVTYTNNGDGATSDSFTFLDIDNNVIQVNVAIAAAVSPITVSPASLPTPQVGTPFSVSLSATGGAAPYSFTQTAGTLPSGLTFTGNTISGTPNQAGAYSFTFTVTDNASVTTTKSYSVSVPNPSTNIAIGTPTAANINSPYSYNLNSVTSGALGPYTYSQPTSGALPAGISLASDGTLSGTPTATGTSNFNVTVTDSSPGPGGPYFRNVPVSLTVQNVPPTTGPVSATVAYNSTNNPITLNITGASATSVAVATQATHGTATASGTSITYTPTTGYAGPDSFTYTATNGAGTSSPGTVTVTVSPPTIIYAPSAPPHPTVGVAYNHSIASASGGAAPYTYAVTAGTLPAGIHLAANGILSGTATAQGTFTVQVRATDSSTGTGPFTSAPANVTLVINSPIIVVSPSSLPQGTVNSPYSQTITASGGTAPYTYVLQSGTLPAGMTLSSGGVLSGTPTQAGPFTFAVQANDSTTGPSAPYHNNTPASYTLTIAGPTITLSPSSLPNATVATAYSQSLSASGGTAPYSFSVTAGAVPIGMTLAPDGTLSGTPIIAGDFSFTATATDAQSFTGQQSYTVHVAAIAPGAPTGASATAGDSQASVSFTAPASDGGSPINSYTVTSSPGGLTASGTASPITVAGLTNGTSYTFTVTATNTAGTGGPSAPSNAVTPKGAQTIIFSNPGTQNFGTSPTLTASASSSLPVTFSSSTTGVCSITSGGALTFASSGTCTINADQAGNGTYLAAPQVSQSFTVAAIAPGAPTIGTATAGNAQASVSFTAPASTGGSPITGYTVTSSPGGLTGTGAGGPVTVTGLTNGTAYTFTVTATNSAGTGGASAASNSVTPQGTQTISFSNPGTQNFGTSPTLAASASSGLPVAFTSTTASVCTVTSSGTLSTVAPGTCTIHADQSGNGAFLAAPQVTQSFAIVVPGGAVSFSSGSTLPNATGETPYSYTITATGGAMPYTFSLTGGSLPNGVSFSPAGVVSGTPLAGGTFSFTVHVVDAATQTADQTFQLTVDAPAIDVTPATLPSGTGGQAYTQNLSSSGGAAPYTYAVTAGTLPAGLTLSSAGALSGTPTASGSFNFTVTATDQHGFQGALAYTFVVNAPTIAITPATLPAGTGGVAYSQTLSSSGGNGGYTYSLSAGALPPGIALSSAGTVSGTPTTAGTYHFTITATDGFGFTGDQAYTFDVNAPSIAITPATLPGGQVSVAYSQVLGASGGNGGYTYSVSAGALPPGIALSSGGTVSGTPTAAGTYSFTVKATDGFGFTGTQAYSLGINQPVPVVVNDTATTAANAPATIPVTANDTGPITSIAVAQAPTHGTATVNGLNAIYTPAANFFGSDSFTYTATGPGGTSAPATVSVTVTPLAVPVAAAQSAKVLAGKSVTIHAAAGAANGPFTAAAVVQAPTSGSAVVQGTDIVYTANADASGAIGFDYTLSNAFGVSQPAHVTVTVNPRPVAPALTATAIAGTKVQVDLTTEARGGPFTGANVVSISPANAGSATIASDSDGGYTLAFTSAATFGGVARITYTLSNAFATSAPGTVDVTVQLRSDPSKNAEVLGVLEAQAEAARRMALGQIGNFQRRLESLHGGGSRAGFTNGITMNSASNQRRTDSLFGMQQQVMGGGGDPFLVPADAPATNSTTSSGDTPNGIGFWTGGAVNFGKLKPGTSYNGIDFTTSGLTVGADKQVTQALALGLGVGYGHDASDIGQHGSRSTVDGYNIAAYGSYQPGESTYVDALAGYQWLQFDARRFVTDNGNTVRGSRDGKQWFASLSVGYRHQADDMLLTPYGRLDLARATLDGYTETGDAVYALNYRSQTVKTSTGTVGLLAQWTVKRDYGVWAPQLRAEFGHDMQGSSQATMRYADLLSGPLYQATLARQSRNHTLLGAGIALQTLKGWSLRAEYQNQLDNTSRNNQSILLSVQKTLPP
ncbi:MAG: putative Ig domain-containing protein [Rhodanobacter sp.]